MTSARRIYGVDFSGSQSAGDKIWLASATVSEKTLFVEACFPARELPNSAHEREQCLTALVEFIESNRCAAFGLDFPFGLPTRVVPEHTDWKTFVTTFSDQYTGPLDLHEKCKNQGEGLPGDRVEYKRVTDVDADAPFCPYNWRMKSQTYYGISELLARLVKEDRARILPMQSARDSLPWVLEVCPSSTLRDRGLPRQGYKGSTIDHEQVRREIIERLEDATITLTDSVRATASQETDGDALDSIVAAVATARAIDERPDVDPKGTGGHIYT